MKSFKGIIPWVEVERVVDRCRTWKQRLRIEITGRITFYCPFCTISHEGESSRLQPLRHFRLNNPPVGQENDEKYSFDWVL